MYSLQLRVRKLALDRVYVNQTHLLIFASFVKCRQVLVPKQNTALHNLTFPTAKAEQSYISHITRYNDIDSETVVTIQPRLRVINCELVHIRALEGQSASPTYPANCLAVPARRSFLLHCSYSYSTNSTKINIIAQTFTNAIQLQATIDNATRTRLGSRRTNIKKILTK